MRFDDRFLDEIKGRVRLSEVIGRSVRLRRSGREFVGLSPFAKEKTPSFYVNDEKGFFHDFSSGKHGDLIAFLQETERLSFREAVERLAAEAGVPLPAPDARSQAAEQKWSSLGDWLELAAKWFEAQLRRPGGEGARGYLHRRALPEGEWGRFRLGYAPAGRTALKDYLVAKGAAPRDLVDAGLLIAPEDGGGAPYDRFRDRIIFPIADGRGRIVSFGGRALDPEARAKYLNGPETALYHKGGLLYGLPEARKLLHVAERAAPEGQGASLVVVEGYMDAIACQRAEIPAVAPLGTALTEDQMEVLWRLHPEPTLAFDADKAGVRAASRAIDRALPLLRAGRSFRFALVSGGKDPDDVLREQGPAALRTQLAQTRPFVEVLFERERELEPLDTPERRAGLKGRLRQAAAAIADKDLAQAYREDLLARFDGLFAKAPSSAARYGASGGDFARAGRPYRASPFGGGGMRSGGGGRYPDPPSPPTAEGRAAAKRLALAIEPVAAAVAQAALAEPAILDAHLEALERNGFGDPALQDLAREIIRLRLNVDTLDSQTLVRHLAERGFAPLLRQVSDAARKSGAPFLADGDSATESESWSHAFLTLTRLAALDQALSAAKAHAGEGLDAQAFSRMKAERDALRREVRTGTVWAGGGS
jgi:DNA primase